jgi:hypothetical protein
MSITFYYHGDEPTLHPVLGQLNPGANEIPDELEALAEDCVAAGLLSHDASPPPAPAPEREPEPEPDEDAEHEA